MLFLCSCLFSVKENNIWERKAGQRRVNGPFNMTSIRENKRCRANQSEEERAFLPPDPAAAYSQGQVGTSGDPTRAFLIGAGQSDP